MNIWTIYQHKFPNGKSYIGKTSRPLQIRWGLNGNNYRKDQPLMHSAIKKHGWDNIDHIILEENLAGAQEINKEVIKSISNTKNLSSLDEKRAIILKSLNNLETYANEDQVRKINELREEVQGNEEVINVKERIKSIYNKL